MLKSNLRSKTSKPFTKGPKIRSQNRKIDPPGYLPVARSCLPHRCAPPPHQDPKELRQTAAPVLHLLLDLRIII